MIALADCNNFYASCERIFNPKIKNKPIIVLSNNDGCVIARSNEAKALGIKMGVPAFKIKKIIDNYNVCVFSTNFTLYGDFSQRVMSILSNNVSSIEIYSIDEAFMNLEGIPKQKQFASKLQKKILTWTGIPISIGIAPNKTLSKVANYIAKKEIDNGVHILFTNKQIKEVLKIFPINKIWGIGNKLYQKLYNENINTAYELTQKSDKWIQNNMSITGLKMVKELRGEVCYNLINKTKPKKSIMTSRTFGKKINNFQELAQAISTYANICAEKLRQEGGCAKTIHIMIFTNTFKYKNQLNYTGKKKISLSNHTNDSLEIVSSSIKALKSIYRNGCFYKKGGVILSDIIPKSETQISLFGNSLDIIKREKLMLTIDKLNNNLGRGKIRLAVNGFEKNWGMKQKNLSPRYTTRINELLRIKY